jgi:hypothetical protein|tara:strand:- start:91 stop:798 length:708 start_codon:yes stop_codon:yes gene_type:complete
MAYNYLGLTNEVLARFNEVALTEAGFTSSRGFQTQCKNAVNDAIYYINTREYSWPYNHATQTETLVAGTTRYDTPATAKHVDYDTFRIVENTTLGSQGRSLVVLDYKDYLNRYIEQEDKSDVGGVPTHVFRTPDNNFGLYPYPDKAYSLKYEYYNYTTALSAATDVPTIPEQYRSVIVDGATAFGYQYRGESGEYQLNFQRLLDGIKSMQSLLSNRSEYIRSTVILKNSSGRAVI